MGRLRVLAVLQAFVLLLTPIPRAQAALWTGACEVLVTVSFETSVRLTNTAPNYSIDLQGLVDLNPLAPGVQSCAVTLDADPLRVTFGGGAGTSSIWTCAAVLASGGWDQVWMKGAVNSPPPMIDQFHTFKGTWDAWTLQVNDGNFSVVGVAQLSLLDNNLKLADCAEAGGIRVLSMVGTMVFQDP